MGGFSYYVDLGVPRGWLGRDDVALWREDVSGVGVSSHDAYWLDLRLNRGIYLLLHGQLLVGEM